MKIEKINDIIEFDVQAQGCWSDCKVPTDQVTTNKGHTPPPVNVVGGGAVTVGCACDSGDKFTAKTNIFL